MSASWQTGLVALLALGLACWLLKVTFAVLVPGERLPASVRGALEHLPPAVLAALVVSATVGEVRRDAAVVALLVAALLVVVAAVHRRTGNLVVAIGIACATVLLVDLVVVPALAG